jgi:hypothetical protein
MTIAIPSNATKTMTMTRIHLLFIDHSGCGSLSGHADERTSASPCKMGTLVRSAPRGNRSNLPQNEDLRPAHATSISSRAGSRFSVGCRPLLQPPARSPRHPRPPRSQALAASSAVAASVSSAAGRSRRISNASSRAAERPVLHGYHEYC